MLIESTCCLNITLISDRRLCSCGVVAPVKYDSKNPIDAFEKPKISAETKHFRIQRKQGVKILMQHYNDVIMSAVVSQITSPTIVYSTVYTGTDQRKYQSSASLAFVRGIHRGPSNSPHNGQVTRKMLPFDDVIMGTSADRVPTHSAKPRVKHLQEANFWPRDRKSNRFWILTQKAYMQNLTSVEQIHVLIITGSFRSDRQMMRNTISTFDFFVGENRVNIALTEW